MSGAIVSYLPQNNQIQNHHHPRNHHSDGSQSCQMICENCKRLLTYPRGSTRICCAICKTIKRVPAEGTEVAKVECQGCGLVLMYPGNAHAVKCTTCGTVTCSKPNSDEDSADQTVIVENPNTLDDNGVLGSSLSVGIRVKRRY